MAISDILPMSHAEYNDQLFRSSIFSDCIIKCQGRMWHLHKAILSPRCEFFWKCFDGPFEESSSTVTMDEEDPDTLNRMLRWIYMLQWPSSSYTSQPWTSDLMLYIIADKYDLSSLAEEAKNALLQTAASCSQTKIELCHARFLESLPDLVDMLSWLFDDLVDQEDLDDFRNDLLRIISPMVAVYVRKQSELDRLVRTVPGFGARLVETMLCTKCTNSNAGQNWTAVGSIFQKTATESANRNGRDNTAPTKPHIPLNEDSETEIV